MSGLVDMVNREKVDPALKENPFNDDSSQYSCGRN
jgi:hypothetical protein